MGNANRSDFNDAKHGGLPNEMDIAGEKKAKHGEGERGPQKRTLPTTFKNRDSASSALITSLLEEKKNPVLNESSMSMLSSLKKVLADENISQKEMVKHMGAVKQLVSEIESSYQVLSHRESDLRRARALIAEGQKGQDDSSLAEQGDTESLESHPLSQVGAGKQLVCLVGSTGVGKRNMMVREQHTREELEKLKEQVEQYKRLVEEVKQKIAQDRENPANVNLPPVLQEGMDSEEFAAEEKRKAEYESIKKEIAGYQEEIQELLDTIAEEQAMMQQVSDLQNKLKKEKQQLTQNQEKLTKDQTKVKEVEKKNKKARAQLERDRTQLEKDRASVKKKEDELKAEKSRLKKMKETLNADKKGVDHDQSQLKKDLKKLEKEKDKVSEEQRKIESDRKKLQKEKDRLKKDLQKAQTAKEKSEKEKQKADQEACNAMKRKEKIMAEIQKALAEEKEKVKELKEIEKTKSQLKAELEQLKKEKRKMEKKRSKSPAQKQHHSSSDETSEVSGLKQRVLELENENKRLKMKSDRFASLPLGASPPPDLNNFQPKSSDAWSKISETTPPSQQSENKSETINTNFAGNPWLRGIRGSMSLKDTSDIPRFGQRFGQMKDSGLNFQGLQSNLPRNFPGPPGFQTQPTTQPMGGLMFAQRGTKVMARYKGDKKWYNAEIKEVILKGAKGPTYIVKFQGYAGNEEVSASEIRPLEDNAHDPRQNGHPGSHTSAVQHHGQPGLRTQGAWPPLKTDRPGAAVWGADNKMMLNGLNGGAFMGKEPNRRQQFREAPPNFYASHIENGKPGGVNDMQPVGFKSMLSIDRDRP